MMMLVQVPVGKIFRKNALISLVSFGLALHCQDNPGNHHASIRQKAKKLRDVGLCPRLRPILQQSSSCFFIPDQCFLRADM